MEFGQARGSARAVRGLVCDVGRAGRRCGPPPRRPARPRPPTRWARRRSSSGSCPTPTRSAAYNQLELDAERPAATSCREEGDRRRAGRIARTGASSLLYFGQLSDFQLADEESPARVELIDTGPVQRRAGARTEALHAHQSTTRWSGRSTRSRPRARSRPATARAAPMDFTINTGDIADSQQLNETEWVRTLAEGGRSTRAAASIRRPRAIRSARRSTRPGLIADGNSPQKYTGVQDYDDYAEGTGAVLRPRPAARRRSPTGPPIANLMDAAQAQFTAAGLDVPYYVTFGNHDAPRPGQRRRQRRLRDGRDRMREAARRRSSPTRAASARRSRPSRRSISRRSRACSRATRRKIAPRPARPEAPVRLEAPVQGGLPGRDPGGRPRVRLRRLRPRRRPRRAPRATTRGAPSPASASSRSTRSLRRA